MSRTPTRQPSTIAPALAALLGVALQTATADEPWRPLARSAPPPAVVASAGPVASPSLPVQPSALPGRRVVAATLERPTPLSAVAVPTAPAVGLEAPRPWGDAPVRGELAPVSYETAPRMETVRFQAPDPPPPLSGPPAVPPPGFAPAVPPPLSTGGPPPPPAFGVPGPTYNGVPVDHPLERSWWDRTREFFTPDGRHSHSGGWFQSDHAFDNLTCGGDLISPVSSPFLFEDPRALTELRPLFFYQSAPNNNPVFHGGSSEFFGVQGRLAFNDRWSLVINKFGFVAVQPKNSDITNFNSKTSFAEFDFGPKWTFYRNEQAGRVAAAGLTLEVPTGSKRVFQNTGSLSLDPYLSFGQTFGRSSYGTFNFLTTVGYSLSVDNSRTEYFHNHYHLDYDVGNLHKFYPLIELNWLYATQFGKRNDVGTEGGDLINFGSRTFNGQRDLVTLAFGGRYKFSEKCQLGTAFEFPISNQKFITDFRFGLDFIIRY